MKRARKGNKHSNLRELREREYKYKSEFTELGYDPDSFVENEEDVSAKPVEGVEENAVPIGAEDGANISSEELQSSEPVIKKEKKGKRFLIFGISFITIVALFFVSLAIGGFFSSPTEEEKITQDYMVPVDKATGKMNVLVLGVDKEGLRTDTIIVASYDLDNDKVNILSIPRDTRMYIGGSYQKINAAHAISKSGKIKGPQGTIEAVTRLTGIPINYYVEFSFDAFKDTIDALGGVDFDVPRNMYYKDPAQNLYIDLDKGFQHLDGDKAEQLVRFRQYPEGDIARVQTQQAFIKAVADQKLNLSIISKLPDLFEVLEEDIETNFTLLDVTKYINNLKELSSENIFMHQLPGQFSGPEYKASYWIVNMTEAKNLIETEFGYDTSDATIHSADGSSVSKDVTDNRVSTPKNTSTTSTKKPSASPKASATSKATDKATKKPSSKPTANATKSPTQAPTKAPTAAPTKKPTEAPVKTPEATKKPARPTAKPTAAADGE